MIDVLISGGPVMIPLGLLSLAAVAILLERLWILRTPNFIKAQVVTTLSQLVAAGDYQRAVEFGRRHPGPFAELVIALIDNREAPYEELRSILEDIARHQLQGLQRGLPALGTIVAGAPLLGLLGTVLGMIDIFSTISTGGAGISAQLSSGIAEALITTAAGLVIAIPTLFIHSFLEARAVSIVADIEAQLLDFVHLVRRPNRPVARETS